MRGSTLDPLSTGTAPSEDGSWLSLGQASRILGVDQSTLRRWADAGQIHSYRTPGGHRRFAEADVRAILTGRSFRSPLGRYGDLGHLALTRIRRRLQRPRGHKRPWLSFDEESRERLRSLGRRLVSLVFEYLGRRTRRGALLGEARQVGRDYGAELLGSGLHLPEVLEAFTFFRKSLDETTRQASQRGGLSAEETLAACEEIMSLGDEVLLGMAEAFDRPPAPQAGEGHPPSPAFAAAGARGTDASGQRGGPPPGGTV